MTKDSTTTPAEAGKDWFTTYTVFARPQGEPGWLGLEGRDGRRPPRSSTRPSRGWPRPA